MKSCLIALRMHGVGFQFVIVHEQFLSSDLMFYSSVSPLWDLPLPLHHPSSLGTPTGCSTVHKSRRTPSSTPAHWSQRSLALLESVSPLHSFVMEKMRNIL